MIRGYWGELQEHEVRNNSYGIFLNTIIINKEDLIIMWAYEGVFFIKSIRLDSAVHLCTMTA